MKPKAPPVNPSNRSPIRPRRIHLFCRLGWHKFERAPTVWGVLRPGVHEGWNAECSRCGAHEWFNWPDRASEGSA